MLNINFLQHTDTEAKEDDNEQTEINIGIRVIALQMKNIPDNIKNKSDMNLHRDKSVSMENVQKDTEKYLYTG